MKKYFAIIGVVAAVTAVNLQATPIQAVGDPFLGHSWGQAFTDTNSYAPSFDTIQISYIQGSTFEYPAIQALGWTTTGNTTYETASGPATTFLLFNLMFNGSPTAPTSM